MPTHRADLRPGAARVGVALATTAALVAVTAVLGLLWASMGGGARDILVTQALVNLVLVMGLQVFIGSTGILSFGHLAFGSVAGYAVALLSIPAARKEILLPEAPWGLGGIEIAPWPALAIAVAITVVLGVLVGLPIVQVGGLAATIITLALLFGTHEVALNVRDLTAGGAGLPFVPGGDAVWPVVLAAVAAAVIARAFRLTRAGRWARAGQEDPLAAASTGIDVRWPWLAGFVLSVLLVAVGSGLRIQALGSISPDFFYFELTLVTLAMLVVGGRRSVTGALVGVLIITVGNELARTLAGMDHGPALSWILRPGLADLFLGGAMVGFMIFRPDGLLGDRELDDWLLRRWRARRAGAPETEPVSAGGEAPTSDGMASARAPGGREAAPTTLELDGVSVVFGGFQALSDVSFTARSDEVVGLIGPNGAGKTTLLNVITGHVSATEGHVRLGEHELTGLPPARIARAGLARTFQNLRLFSQLSVRENVALAAMSAERYRQAHHELPTVDELLEAAGLAALADRRAGELDYGAQRRLEIARAAALAPDMLLLDEPTSGMSDAESAAMIAHVRSTAAAIGAGVLVIDHDLHFITNASDRIHVLDHGVRIASGTPDEIQRDPAVIEAYLGSRAERA